MAECGVSSSLSPLGLELLERLCFILRFELLHCEIRLFWSSTRLNESALPTCFSESMPAFPISVWENFCRRLSLKFPVPLVYVCGFWFSFSIIWSSNWVANVKGATLFLSLIAEVKLSLTILAIYSWATVLGEIMIVPRSFASAWMLL